MPRSKGSKKPSETGWLRRFWGDYRLVIRACAIFFSSIVIFIFLYSRLLGSQAFDAFLGFTAWSTAFLLNLTGRGVAVQGTLVSSQDFSFRIVDLCTAVVPMMIFTSAVIAFPSRPKEKALGLLLGIGGLYVVNQIRLVSLFYIGSYVPGIFSATHLLVWQSLMILLAIGLWLFWAQKYVRPTFA